METPFVFGTLASGIEFTNRVYEIKRLKNNFLSGINTMIISPRRWGKSSLVRRAVKEIKESNALIKVVKIDLFNVRTKEDFYRLLAEQTLKATTSKIQEVLSLLKNHLKYWIPRISFSPDQIHEISLGLNWQEVSKNPDEILDLPQRIASTKGWKIIICIDEFQNIGFYRDAEGFQKQLRSHWQQHNDVSYCLFGSKRHMLMHVFTSPSMPFYKFGDVISLEKIDSECWNNFITSRFRATGKEIKPEQALWIAGLVENHPYYVQQLAQLCWFRCEGNMMPESIDQAFDSLVLQLSLLFQNLTESLSTTQVNYLRAIINEEIQLSSKDIIQRYHLGTSANVSRIKKALIDKEIIDILQGKAVFLDPLYKVWLKKYYFQS